MDLSSLMNSPWFTYLILPVLIVMARLCDVTLGTIRIMFVSRGNKPLAAILGFFEILIWLIAIGQIMQNLDNVFCYLAYATGFALGNYAGIGIEERVAYGKIIMRIITRKDATQLIANLRAKGFGVTVINAEGGSGPVKVVYSIMNRSHADHVIKTIDRYNPKAFFTIEDVRWAKEGVFHTTGNPLLRMFFRPPKLSRQIRNFHRKLLQRKSK